MQSKVFTDLVTIALLALATVIRGAVIREATIDNPCMRDPTSTGTPQYSSLRSQVQTTMTEANTANTKCQTFKDNLKTVLSQSEMVSLDSPLMNVPGLPLGYNESTLTANNVFVRNLRHSALNITIIYNLLKNLALSGNLQSFDEPLQDVMSAMITVKCRITLTSEVIESNFTTEESQIDNELFRADSYVFANIDEEWSEEPLPDDEKDSIDLGYLLSRYMQLFMATLNDVLDAKTSSLEQ